MGGLERSRPGEEGHGRATTVASEAGVEDTAEVAMTTGEDVIGLSAMAPSTATGAGAETGAAGGQAWTPGRTPTRARPGSGRLSRTS
jgi:hypothetical protein